MPSQNVGVQRTAMRWTLSASILLLHVTAVTEGLASDTQVSELVQRAKQLAPEVFRTAPEMIAGHGYPVETHSVQTADGYVLSLHRIPGRRERPVILQHGLANSADLWLLPGPNKSLAYLLADRGYDVWLGNARGNPYCRKHVTLSERNPDFWKFTWHEMGMYDIPAVVDYVLAKTGQRRLNYVGHSMGNTMLYVTLALRPEYNQRIGYVVSLAPAIFGQHLTAPLARDLVRVQDTLKRRMVRDQLFDFLPMTESRSAFAYYLCRDGSSSRHLCEDIITQIGGPSSGVNRTILPSFLARIAGASSFTVFHFLQIVRSGRFEQYDHGPERNWQVYGSRQPPEYDLGRLTVPIAIHTSDGDDLVPSVDVKYLARQLPNVVEFRKVAAPQFNHFDYIMHTNAKSLLFDHVLATLDQYQSNL